MPGAKDVRSGRPSCSVSFPSRWPVARAKALRPLPRRMSSAGLTCAASAAALGRYAFDGGAVCALRLGFEAEPEPVGFRHGGKGRQQGQFGHRGDPKQWWWRRRRRAPWGGRPWMRDERGESSSSSLLSPSSSSSSSLGLDYLRSLMGTCIFSRTSIAAH